VATFQRARSEQQREARRQSILETAASMLNEMPVSELSLNELSRRVGLAKSNVFRYFESREAVLLDLLAEAASSFLAEIDAQLPGQVESVRREERAVAVASKLASAFAAHPMLCELLSAQAGVLEHNVSVQVAARYKRSARDSLVGLAQLLRRIFPKLPIYGSEQAASTIIVLVGALWTRSRPAPAVRKACESDPSLAFFNIPFEKSLQDAIAVFLNGLLVRSVDISESL
jgi:AcrR family transcriptional regulator